MDLVALVEIQGWISGL